MYASINEKFNVRSSSFGTQGYNVVQCSDDMWYEDTLNDICDLHISPDNFKLIAKFYDNYKVVVKKCRKVNIQAMSAMFWSRRQIFGFSAIQIFTDIQFNQNILSP